MSTCEFQLNRKCCRYSMSELQRSMNTLCNSPLDPPAQSRMSRINTNQNVDLDTYIVKLPSMNNKGHWLCKSEESLITSTRRDKSVPVDKNIDQQLIETRSVATPVKPRLCAIEYASFTCQKAQLP